MHSLYIAGKDPAEDRTECFLQSPSSPVEEGLCGVITSVGRFFLVGNPMGRKLLIHFIQFYLCRSCGSLGCASRGYFFACGKICLFAV